MEYLNIGPTPPEEDCLPNTHPQARAEVEIYKRQLEREFPAGRFSVKSFPHDFGTYWEVVAWYGEELDRATNQAAWEAECGQGVWDAQAREELAALRRAST